MATLRILREEKGGVTETLEASTHNGYRYKSKGGDVFYFNFG